MAAWRNFGEQNKTKQRPLLSLKHDFYLNSWWVELKNYAPLHI